MTDWSQLTHAYGAAEDIPVLLGQASPDGSSQVWSDLWSRLCHQGSVYSASHAAIPALAEMAQQWPAPARFEPILLAAAIVAGIDQPWHLPDVHSTYAAQIEILATLTRRALAHRSLAADAATYVYVLQALLAFEGVEVWGNQLNGINDEEYEVPCPHCDTENFVVFGKYGRFSTLDGRYMEAAEAPREPLEPASPANLSPLARRLHSQALADGHPEVADKITYLFGDARCVDCGRMFRVDEAVSAQWT